MYQYMQPTVPVLKAGCPGVIGFVCTCKMYICIICCVWGVGSMLLGWVPFFLLFFHSFCTLSASVLCYMTLYFHVYTAHVMAIYMQL